MEENPYSSPKSVSGPADSPPRRFWPIAIAECVLVAAVLVGWFYVRTAAYLAGPPDPDRYAQTWSFQLVVFAFFWILPAVLVMGIALTLQASFFKCYRYSSHGRLQS